MTLTAHFMRRKAINETLKRQIFAISIPRCSTCGCDQRMLCNRCRAHRCPRCEQTSER